MIDETRYANRPNFRPKGAETTRWKRINAINTGNLVIAVGDQPKQIVDIVDLARIASRKMTFDYYVITRMVVSGFP